MSHQNVFSQGDRQNFRPQKTGKITVQYTLILTALNVLQFKKNVCNFKLFSSNTVAKLHSAVSIYVLFNNVVGSSDYAPTNGTMIGE